MQHRRALAALTESTWTREPVIAQTQSSSRPSAVPSSLPIDDDPTGSQLARAR
jgi:hypothetical protein